MGACVAGHGSGVTALSVPRCCAATSLIFRGNAWHAGGQEFESPWLHWRKPGVSWALYCILTPLSAALLALNRSDIAQGRHLSRATKASQRQHALKSLNHSAFHASHGDLNPGENS